MYIYTKCPPPISPGSPSHRTTHSTSSTFPAWETMVEISIPRSHLEDSKVYTHTHTLTHTHSLSPSLTHTHTHNRESQPFRVHLKLTKNEKSCFCCVCVCVELITTIYCWGCCFCKFRLSKTLHTESESGEEYNYDTATVLIVTFVVNNYLHDDDNKKAMAWEKAMLDYLHDHKDRAKFIDIEYSTEVHIQCICDWIIAMF